jgi:peptide/nickel transport system substrate-binding protein
MYSRVLSLIILVVSLAACQSHRPIPKDTIVIGVDLPPLQLDPRLSTDAVSSKMKHLVFSGLMKFDDSLEIVPDVAETYDVSDDGLRYAFLLRSGVFFHDGSGLTSADVKATYESMMDPKLGSPYQGSLGIVEKIETPSTERVIFILKKPFPPFLTSMTLGILNESQALKFRDGSVLERDAIAGTGPYAFERGQRDWDEKIEFVRFDRYFGPPAKTECLVVRVIQDPTLRAMELLKGRLDLVQNAIPYALVPVLKKNGDLSFASGNGVNFNYLAFNFANPYLKRREVREAIALAVDRDRIIKYKLAGLARPADSILSPGHWAHAPDLKPFSFDLRAAKKLLDEAGFLDPDGDGAATRFDIVYKTSTNKERLEIVQLIAENLRSIGIGVTVKSYEFGTLSRDVRQGDFDVFSMTWVGVSDPDIYYSITHSSQVPPAGANRGRYSNPGLDALLDASRAETDPDKRRVLFHRIQKIAYEDFVYVPLWYDENFVATGKSLTGYSLRPDASWENVAGAFKTDP